MTFNRLRAVSSLGCPDLSLAEVFALAAKHRIDAVELRVLSGMLDLPAYFRKQFVTPAALAGFVRSQSVRIVGLGTSLRLVGHGRTERDAFLEFLPWADALDGVRLRVFDGGKNMDAGEVAEAASTVRWWQAERASRGWRSDIMVETHDSLLTSSAIHRFLAAAPPETKILWDTHHTWRIGGEDPVVTWRAIRHSAVHLHVKDSVSGTGRNGKYAYVLPGAGEFPMKSLRKVLQDDRFDGPLSLEWEKQWHVELPPLEDALEHATATAWW